jgi:hypothetical protein
MAPYLGSRLSTAQVEAAIADQLDGPSGLSEDELDSIAVYEIPALAGREFHAARATDLPRTLASLLAERLGVLSTPDSGFDGALRKYGLLSVSLPAPTLGDVPMALEVAAEVTSIGACTQRESWWDVRALDNFDDDAWSWPATARICSASYLNVTGLARGVGFYL